MLLLCSGRWHLCVVAPVQTFPFQLPHPLCLLTALPGFLQLPFVFWCCLLSELVMNIFRLFYLLWGCLDEALAIPFLHCHTSKPSITPCFQVLSLLHRHCWIEIAFWENQAAKWINMWEGEQSISFMKSSESKKMEKLLVLADLWLDLSSLFHLMQANMDLMSLYEALHLRRSLEIISLSVENSLLMAILTQ